MDSVRSRTPDDFPYRLMPITLGVSRTNRVCYGVREKKQIAFDIAVASRISRYIFYLITYRREVHKEWLFNPSKYIDEKEFYEKNSKRNPCRM